MSEKKIVVSVMKISALTKIEMDCLSNELDLMM